MLSPDTPHANHHDQYVVIRINLSRLKRVGRRLVTTGKGVCILASGCAGLTVIVNWWPQV